MKNKITLIKVIKFLKEQRKKNQINNKIKKIFQNLQLILTHLEKLKKDNKYKKQYFKIICKAANLKVLEKYKIKKLKESQVTLQN